MAREGERRERSSRDDIKPSAGRPPNRASPMPPIPSRRPAAAAAASSVTPSVQCRSASAEPDQSVAHLWLAQLGSATLLPRRAAQRGHGPLEALPLSLPRSLSLDISAHSVRNLHCGLQISQLLSWLASLLLLLFIHEIRPTMLISACPFVF